MIDIRLKSNNYETTMAEKEQLNSLVNSCQEEIRQLKKQLKNCYCNRTDCAGRIKDSKKYDSLVQAQEAQQKEFIKYLEDMLDDENDMFSVVRVKDVLQKYIEIVNGTEQK